MQIPHARVEDARFPRAIAGRVPVRFEEPCARLRHRSSTTSRLLRVGTVREVAALALVAVAAATVLPEAGWNATAHYALVESLADGTPRIDGHLNQGGDVAWVDGHFYAAKSPGLAFASLPLYATFDALGAVPAKEVATEGPPGARGVRKVAVWQLNLVVVAAFFGLLLLMRYAANACAPGSGLAVAVILGLGTMLLPFSTATLLMFSRRRWDSAPLLSSCADATLDSPLPGRDSSRGWPSLRRRRSRSLRWRLRPGCSSTGRGSNGAASTSPDSWPG